MLHTAYSSSRQKMIWFVPDDRRGVVNASGFTGKLRLYLAHGQCDIPPQSKS